MGSSSRPGALVRPRSAVAITAVRGAVAIGAVRGALCAGVAACVLGTAPALAQPRGWIVVSRALPAPHDATDASAALPPGAVVAALPPTHRVIDRDDGRWFHDGVHWYRAAGERYVVVPPPVGWLVHALPEQRTVVWAQGLPYTWAAGHWFLPAPGGWQVTVPPVRATSMPFAPESRP